jgi:hypothetical protein
VYNHFPSADKKWEMESCISLIIDISGENLYSVVVNLLSMLPNNLAFGVLADLVEREDFPVVLLSEVYDKGDKACKVSICLRDNLPLEIIERCENTDDLDVHEHYMQRHRRIR